MKRSQGKSSESSVNIATLKAQLARYLRIVKQGGEVIVLDHKMPVAKIVPFESSTSSHLDTIKPQSKFSTVAALEIPPLEQRVEIDSTELLREERSSR